MKRKRFLAVLTAASLSASMALTAMPVFAGDVVSVEASDATGSFSSATTLGDSFKDALNTAISTVNTSDLSSALKDTALSTALGDLASGTVDVTEGGTTTNYKLSNFEITAHTAPSYKTTADGGKIVMPVLTIKADVNDDSQIDGTYNVPDGSVTFTIEADKLTKSEKVQAIVAVLNAAGSDGVLDTATYKNADNTTSLTTAVNGILASNKLSNKSVLGTISDYATLTVSQGAFTAATKSAAGSEVVNVEVKTTLTQADDATATNTDPAWDSTAADQTKPQEYKASASYTATIKKLGTNATDSDYQAKVKAALEAVTLTNTDIGSATTGTSITSSTLTGAGKEAYDKIVKALDSVGAAEDHNVSFSFRHLTKASHKADGSVEILFDQKRDNDTGSEVEYPTVTLTITHSDDAAAVEKEVATKANTLFTGLVADSEDVKVTSTNKDDQVKEIKSGVETLVNKALVDTLEGTKTIASEIKKVEVSVDASKYTNVATASNAGELGNGAVTIKVTYNDKLPSTLATVGSLTGARSSDKVATYTNGTAIKIYRVSEVAATALALNDEYAINTNQGSDVTITPKFTPANSNTYKIRWTLSGDNASKFTATAADGTALTTANTQGIINNQGLKVGKGTASVGDSVDIKAQLIDDDNLVVATATTKVTVIKGFSDVQNTHDYAYNAINYLSGVRTVKKNDAYTDVAVITGTGNNMFTPDSDVTRAQFVTFLYRLAQWDGELSDKVTTGTSITVDGTSKNAEDAHGEAVVGASGSVTGYKFPTFKDADASTKFTDVDANAYYAKAVDWAVANGITSGKTDTTFAPNAKVTRAEAVTFMYRYFAANQNYNAADFTDVADTAYYANAVGWASSNGVTQGKTAATFAPNDTTTRKEAAAFIYRATNTAKINK